MKRIKEEVLASWDKLSMWLAYRLVPKRVVMYCFLRLASYCDGEKKNLDATGLELLGSFKESNPLPDYRWLWKQGG